MKFISYLKFCIFTVSFLSHKSSCNDAYYEACTPKSCGNLTIKFPFYIQNHQLTYCGYPGFNLTCQHNEYLMLSISKDAYRIQEISYANQSIRVSNDALWSSSSSCKGLTQIRNFSLDTDAFELINNRNMVILSDCLSSPLLETMQNHQVDCGNDNRVLAISTTDPGVSNGMLACDRAAVQPVDKGRNASDGIVEELKRGFHLKWSASDCSACDQSGGRCGFFEADYHFKCYCSDRPHAYSCPQRSRKRSLRLILATGIPAACVVIAAGLLCLFWFNCSSKNVMLLKEKTKDHENIEAIIKKFGSLAPKRYRYQEIKKVTGSFECKLGQGGYGGVYKGKLPDGQDVAVKILNTLKGDGEEFLNEVASISRTSHVNVVTLLGFCFEGKRRALVYEYMPNGSLDKFIPKEESSTVCQLGWQTFYEIALGIARGLEYLHRGCNTRILHFDIKPHNILLDANFRPKISDFGLAKLCVGDESIISMMGTRGTPGYIAPEVFSRNFGGVSHKSDVYSYGMMILEMVGGKKKINERTDSSSKEYFPEWIYNRLEQNVDFGLNDISSDEENGIIRKMVIVGLWCIQTDPSNRPSMKRVLEMLEGNLEYLQIPPKPFLNSVPEPIATDYSTTSTW